MEDVESRLRAADPASDLRGREPWVADLAGLMAREVVDAAPRRVATPGHPRRRRHRGLVIGLVTAAALGVPTVVAAHQLWQARTGTYGTAATSEEDGSEWLNPCADDFGEYITQLTPDLELPPTTTWSELSTILADEAADPAACAGSGARAQETWVQSRFLDLAQGAWLHHALELHDDGEIDAAESAASMLSTALRAQEELETLADDGWRFLDEAALSADWAVLADWAERVPDEVSGGR